MWDISWFFNILLSRGQNNNIQLLPQIPANFEKGLFSLHSLFAYIWVLYATLAWFLNVLHLKFSSLIFCLSSMADFYILFFFLIVVCIGYCFRRNWKTACPFERKELLYCDLFSLLASGTAVKKECVVLDHKNTLWNLNKMPFIRKILLLFRKHFFQPNGAGLLSRECCCVRSVHSGLGLGAGVKGKENSTFGTSSHTVRAKFN